MLTVALLGPVEVRRDGLLLEVPAGKTTEVLARLALDAGQPVGTEALIEDLWADAASTGRNTLQSKISQLRRALGDAALVEGGSLGYALLVPAESVDTVRAARLAARSTQRRRAGDAAGSLEAATAALELFRGSSGAVLVGAGDGDWLHPHRARFEEMRLGLLEDRLAAQVELGSGGAVVGELEELVARYPLREGLWSSLIGALYRLHRQADALAAYARLRRILIDELGVEPDPALVALEQHILAQDLGAGGEHVRGVRELGPIGNLPSLFSVMVGRAAELADLSELLGTERLVTIVGPAGVGKTRTAIEVGRGVGPRRVPGGVWLVRFDAVDPDTVARGDDTTLAQMVAEALAVPGGASRLAERLDGSDALLLLDNCEHVLDAVADLVVGLLDAAPGLRVLATSQVPLGVDGERVVLLEPLPLADSMALFARRAHEVRRSFELDGDTATTVEELCHHLDGLPLAIELAAARVKSLSIAEIARRLDDRFVLLTDPTSRRPTRRRALSGAIGWSYDLLFPDDQRGLWALATFSGGASLPAAESVMTALDVPAQVAVDIVGRLVDRSLVIVDMGADGTVSYRLLDSIRAFARVRLEEAGLLDLATAAHAAWFARFADECDAWVRGGGQQACVAAVRAARSDVDAALAWCAEHDPALGVRTAIGLGWTWVVLGDGVAGASRVRGALEVSRRARETSRVEGASTAVTEADTACGLLVAGWLEASAGNVDQADTDLAGALAIYQRVGDERGFADALRHLAFLRIQQGRPAEVLDACAASLRIVQPLNLAWETSGALVLAAYGSIMVGDLDSAARSAQEGLEILTPLNDSWGLTHAEAMLGSVASAQGRFEDAAASFDRAVTRSLERGFAGQAALHLSNRGRAEAGMGLHERAARTLREAIDAGSACGDQRIASTARIQLATLLSEHGEHGEALELARTADAWYRGAGGGEGAEAAHDLVLTLEGRVSRDLLTSGEVELTS